jgi:hypothetical protein
MIGKKNQDPYNNNSFGIGIVNYYYIVIHYILYILNWNKMLSVLKFRRGEWKKIKKLKNDFCVTKRFDEFFKVKSGRPVNVPTSY